MRRFDPPRTVGDALAMALELSKLRPGERVVYHVGDLVTDRAINESLDRLAFDVAQLAAPPREAVCMLRGKPFIVKGKGLGTCLQQRVDGVTHYIFQRGKKT